jgi:hypothetical protein
MKAESGLLRGYFLAIEPIAFIRVRQRESPFLFCAIQQTVAARKKKISRFI